VAILTPLSLFIQRKSLRYPLDMKLDGLSADVGTEGRRTFLRVPGIEHQFFHVSPPSVDTAPTELTELSSRALL
jgi:hypothetical protein